MSGQHTQELYIANSGSATYLIGFLKSRRSHFGFTALGMNAPSSLF